MNNLIVNLIFGMLTCIFLTGIVIIITNVLKIKNFNDLLKKRLKEVNQIEAVDLRTQNKLIPVLVKPILQLPASVHKMKMIK